MYRIATVAAAVVAIALPGSIAAQNAGATRPSFALVGEVQLEMGGDRVLEATFTDGTTQTMRAGQGGTAAVGLEFRPNLQSPIGVRATAGFKYVTTAASNADIKLTRIPLELVGSYRFPNEFFVGGGFVRHAAVKFDGDDLVSDVDLNSSNGGTVEIGWRWAALTYTMLEYSTDNGDTWDASSFGVSLSMPMVRF